MQMRDAMARNREWGEKPCAHERLEKEYDLGMDTGDVVCVTCGAAFFSREQARQDAIKTGAIQELPGNPE
jgi:hypothetical protein